MFLTTSYVTLDHNFEEVIFSILNLHACSFIWCIWWMFFSSIKEINRLVSKGVSNIYYWGKQTFSKLRFSRKENLKKCTSFEEKKGTRYIRGNAYFRIITFSCLSSTKPCLRFVSICFVREIKFFYQSSLGNEVDFTNVMNVSQNILAKN